MPYLNTTSGRFEPGAWRAGGGSSSLASIGSQILFYGDGVMSEGAAAGLRNMPTVALLALNARVMPSPGWMQCKSGGDMDTIYARRDSAIDQQPDIFVIASQGHNDHLMENDPDTLSTYIDKWTRNADACKAGCPSSRFFVCSTLPSTVVGETSTIRNKVWARQQAWATANGAIYIATGEAFDPVTMSDDGTHPNQLGGALGETVIAAAISPYVVAATKTEILDLLRGGTYPGFVATNLDVDVLLSGTTGTKSGTVAPTGNYATGKRITNNLTNGTSVAVTVSKDAQTGYDRQIAVVSGTPASANTIVQDETGSTTLTGAWPGRHPIVGMGLVIDNGAGAAPTGLQALSLALGSYGSIGSSAATTGTYQRAIDGIILAAPRCIFTGGAYTVNAALTTRWSNVALTGRTIIEKPVLGWCDTRTRTRPCYTGADTISGANYLLRLTGTLASGAGTLRAEPGVWAPYGLTEADFTERRIYKGGSATIGTGTLVATLTGSTWTWVTSGIIAGDTLWLEVDANNGVGATRTARSATVYTAA